MPDLTDDEAADAILSIFNLDTHEAVHAVLRRACGDDVWIEEIETGPITRWNPWRPPSLEWDVMSIIGPEVYMSINKITFTEFSVGADRSAVDALLAEKEDADQIKASARARLEVVFACPRICEAITVLADRLCNYASLHPLSSDVIHPPNRPDPSSIRTCRRTKGETEQAILDTKRKDALDYRRIWFNSSM